VFDESPHCTTNLHTVTIPERKGSAFGEQVLSGFALGAGALGAVAAGFMYLTAFPWARRRENPSLVWKAARNKFFVDEVYQFLFTGVGKLAAVTAAFFVDNRIIDGAVNGVARGIGVLGVGGRKVQTGLVRNYAIGVMGGGIVLVIWLLVRTR
jgi:NADH-quinone oxidoreductase subunit L